jgi:hypothetical protein
MRSINFLSGLELDQPDLEHLPRTFVKEGDDALVQSVDCFAVLR